jgi:hypothetical protein
VAYQAGDAEELMGFVFIAHELNDTLIRVGSRREENNSIFKDSVLPRSCFARSDKELVML